MTAIELIQERRKHHVSSGYDAAHDDQHTDGALAVAAAHLIEAADDAISVESMQWPEQEWIRDLFEKYDGRVPPIDILVESAALLVAEIERLQRIR